MVDRTREDPPFEGGSQPVPERPTKTPTGGRAAVQTVIVAIAILVLVAAILWLIVPFGG
ncbi:MAG: hypothetical protein WD766_11845 [Gemmatimonadota bacterium]